MKNIDTTLVDKLKHAVELKFGRKILYAKDATLLAIDIDTIVNKQVSQSTIKRMWGLVKCKFQPSKYTLNALSEYLGFVNWDDYKGISQKLASPENDYQTWESVKKKADSITEYSFQSIKNRMGIPYVNTIVRDFARQKFEQFLASNHTATALVAPAGYGKSTIIAQMVEDFFIRKNARFPNDIVWLIDCGIIDVLMSKDFDIENYIIQLMGYDVHVSPRRFFQRHSEMRKGKMILIIDGLNEITSQNERLNLIIDKLIKIIASNDKTEWFKIIITCRTNTWYDFVERISECPNIQNKWFDVNLTGDFHQLSNLNLLTENEIDEIFRRNSFPSTYENIQLTNNDVIDIINIPYFLQTYMSLSKDDIFVSDIDLFNKFVVKNILHAKYRIEKFNIINAILKASNYGQRKSVVNKSKVYELIKANESAYNELLSYGILYEYEIDKGFQPIDTYIKFSNDTLYEFFLTNLWLKENTLDIKLFERVVEFYLENHTLKIHIVKWFIKYAFRETKIELLKNIFNILDVLVKTNINCTHPNECCQEIINQIGYELRRYRQLRDILIPYYASIPKGQVYYFQRFIDIDFLVLSFADRLDFLLQYDESAQTQIFAHSLKFWKAFLSENHSELRMEYNILKSLPNCEGLSLYYQGYMYSCSLLYQYYEEKEINISLLNKYHNIENEYALATPDKKMQFTQFQVSVIDTLFFCQKYDFIIEIYEKIKQDSIVYQHLEHSIFFKIIKLIYALSLLKTGQQAKAFEIYNNTKIEMFPINMKHFGMIKYYLIKAEFLHFQYNIAETRIALEKVINWSKMLGFKYFENWAVNK